MLPIIRNDQSYNRRMEMKGGIQLIEKNIYGKDLAFVVIDTQKKFILKHEDKDNAQDAKVRRINEISEKFRAAGRPVIFVKYNGDDSECHYYKGIDGNDLFDDIVCKPEDFIIDKCHMNSYIDTVLEETIKEQGCNSALFAGTVTQYCVMSTYFASFDHDIIPYIAQDACIATRDAINLAAEEICKTLTIETIEGYLRGDESVVGKPSIPSHDH